MNTMQSTVEVPLEVVISFITGIMMFSSTEEHTNVEVLFDFGSKLLGHELNVWSMNKNVQILKDFCRVQCPDLSGITLPKSMLPEETEQYMQQYVEQYGPTRTLYTFGAYYGHIDTE